MPDTPQHPRAHGRAIADLPCITCGAPLVRKRAFATGHTFYGCANYPSCKVTSNRKDGINQKDYKSRKRAVSSKLAGNSSVVNEVSLIDRILDGDLI